MRLPLKLRDTRYRLFYGLLLRRGYELATLCAPGSICPWTICPTGLNVNSVVYSGGVGSDISFEHELVKKTGCQVVLLDPSPAGKRTMALPENNIPNFKFFPLALAAHTGHLNIAPPGQKPEEDSWFASDDAPGGHQVGCTDLKTLMAQSGHARIDLLKLDIEGAEYEVIEHLLAHHLPISQISVEFHHGIVPGITRGQTIGSILRLILRGYKLVDQSGANHTFVRR